MAAVEKNTLRSSCVVGRKIIRNAKLMCTDVLAALGVGRDAGTCVAGLEPAETLTERSSVLLSKWIVAARESPRAATLREGERERIKEI